MASISDRSPKNPGKENINTFTRNNKPPPRYPSEKPREETLFLSWSLATETSKAS